MTEENKIKADAVHEFVAMMIGAFEAGFIDTPNLNLAQLHRVAQNHAMDSFGVALPDIIAEWGEATAKECGFSKEL